MTNSSPAQLYCTLVGGVLVIVGIIGFFYSSGFDTGVSGVASDTDDALGVLAVNGWHNVIHIALGLLGLACARSLARSYALGVGLLYLVLAIWGFVDSDNIILGLIPLNTEDSVLHLILGLTGVAAGAASPAPAKRVKPSRPKRSGESKPPERSEPAAKSKPSKPATT
jgi:hypothetical protein